jgi:uncharacterized protein with HEPN domain
MYDQQIADKLELIQENIEMIRLYFQPIGAGKDFYIGQGKMIFDAILMRLQALGQNVKALYSSNSEIFTDFENEAISIIRFRDIISHHYEKLDTDIVYDICPEYLPLFDLKITALINLYK